MDMSLYPFCSFFVCLPEAISINNLNISSVIFSKSLLSINSPALKSIQLLFLFARRELEATLIVGTLAPSGVPLPVVNNIIFAPAAVKLVVDTISFPGPVKRFNPCFLQCSPFLQSIVKWPIGLPYLIIFSPFSNRLKVPCAQREYRLKAWPFCKDRRFLSNPHPKSRHLPKRQKRCHCVWF